MDPDVRAFLALSSVLTDEPALDKSLAAAHLARTREHPLNSALAPLLARFLDVERAGGDLAVGVKDRIFADGELAPLAKAITFLWFAGGFAADGGGVVSTTAEQHFGALVWDAVGAHPAGRTNGYFGHWKYPAER